MSRQQEKVAWWALLAPSASSEPLPGIILLSHDAGRVLDASYQFGGVTLRPADQQIIEYVPSRSVGGWAELVSWPVIVEGKSSARSSENRWTVAALAGPQVHLAAAMLSLAWGEAWTVRVTPTPSASVPPQVPELPSPSPWPDRNPQIGLRDPCALPPWFDRALARLDPQTGDPLASALTTWHQGLLLFTEHPSMALIAFVAAVESVASSEALAGELPPPPEPCPECLNIPAAAARFWAAVDLTAEEDDRRELRQAKVYDLRSATGHRGAVHGFENRFGASVTMPLTEMDEAGRFVGDTLQRVARIGRALLIRAIAAAPTRL